MWHRTDPSDWFRLTRRELVRALLGFAAYLPVRLLLAASGGQPEAFPPPPALGPFLDTLLPDDGTPSATQAGVDQEILRQMHANPRIRDMVVMGCLWLDQRADKLGAEEFAVLDAASREAVVRIAEASPARTVPRMFFGYLLGAAYQHYYSQPAVWRTLGYAGPPQPQGFMDFAGPPREIEE